MAEVEVEVAAAQNRRSSTRWQIEILHPHKKGQQDVQKHLWRARIVAMIPRAGSTVALSGERATLRVGGRPVGEPAAATPDRRMPHAHSLGPPNVSS